MRGLILQSKTVLDLIADGSFLNAARSYLNCETVFANANLWWSFPANASIGRQSEMAQLMHYDGNWNHFINIFIYLSDVDQPSGPHTFIRRSHVPNNRPKEYYSTEGINISDQELAQALSCRIVLFSRWASRYGLRRRYPLLASRVSRKRTPGWYSNCFIQIHLHLAVDVTGLRLSEINHQGSQTISPKTNGPIRELS